MVSRFPSAWKTPGFSEDGLTLSEARHPNCHQSRRLPGRIPSSHEDRSKKLISPTCGCSVTSFMSDSLRCHGLWPTRLLCPWYSSGKNTKELPSSSDLPNQGICLCLLHCRRILYLPSHPGSPSSPPASRKSGPSSNVHRLVHCNHYSSDPVY